MKKLLSVVFACAIAASALAGCGKKDVKLSILDTEYTVEDYAICVAKENSELLDKINAALKEINDDGTQKKIVDKYISNKEHDLTFQENADGKQELHMATIAQFPP